jgi:hypothetical protein
MSYLSLLIQLCTIQAKSLTTTGYEQIESWEDVAEDVPCRKDKDNSPSISDGDMRKNTDNDLFYFMPTVVIERGNRIIIDGETYDVLKVNKSMDSTEVHHLEVTARMTDNK